MCCELASHMPAVAYAGLLLPTKDHGCLAGSVYMTDSPYLDRKKKKVVSDQSSVLFHITTSIVGSIPAGVLLEMEDYGTLTWV
jgi:hypothetical protein